MPSLGRPKISRKLTNVNCSFNTDRLKAAKEQAEKAIKARLLSSGFTEICKFKFTIAANMLCFGFLETFIYIIMHMMVNCAILNRFFSFAKGFFFSFSYKKCITNSLKYNFLVKIYLIYFHLI